MQRDQELPVDPLDLARRIRDELVHRTGRNIPRPRTLSGLSGSLGRMPLTLLDKQQKKIVLTCIGFVRRAYRDLGQGKKSRAVAHLKQAIRFMEDVKRDPEISVDPYLKY